MRSICAAGAGVAIIVIFGVQHLVRGIQSAMQQTLLFIYIRISDHGV